MYIDIHSRLTYTFFTQILDTLIRVINIQVFTLNMLARLISLSPKVTKDFLCGFPKIFFSMPKNFKVPAAD